MLRDDLQVTLPDGSTVGYAEVGDPDGSPVLHLHGTPGSRLEVFIPAARRAAEAFRQAFARDLAEVFRQGGRGLALDYTLEARPWGVPLAQIQVPIEIWHGEDDRLVSPQASRILASVLPAATTHFVPGAGHLLDASDHVTDVLHSVLSGSRR